MTVKQSGGLYALFSCRSVEEIQRDLNRILALIANRLDRLEGLKGNPTFYKSTFNISDLTTSNVLKATSTTQAAMGVLDYSEVDGAVGDIDSGGTASVDLVNSLMSIVDENEVVVHQLQAQMLKFNSDLNMFVTHEDIDNIGSLEGDVDGPTSAVDSDMCEFDGITGKLIKDGGITHVSVIASNAHQVAEDAIVGIIQGDGAGNYSAAAGLSGLLLTTIYDENSVAVHQYPIEWLGLNNETFMFLSEDASPVYL